MNLIQKVFRTARLPPFEDVSIADGVNINGGAWTDSDYEINVGPNGFQSDLSFWPNASTLVHEMTHVWQYYNRTLTKAHAFGAHLRAWLGGYDDDLYTYKLDGTWNDMGFEGQAQMVEDWYDMGMKEEGYRYIFMKDVVWSGNPAARSLTRTELAMQNPDIPGVEELFISDKSVSAEAGVPLNDSYLISLLQPRYAAADVAGFGARAAKLEQVFRLAKPAEALPLLSRLTSRKPDDLVARYFYGHLSNPTRTKLLQILQERASGR